MPYGTPSMRAKRANKQAYLHSPTPSNCALCCICLAFFPLVTMFSPLNTIEGEDEGMCVCVCERETENMSCVATWSFASNSCVFALEFHLVLVLR